MRRVSNRYKELMRYEENNIKHQYRIYNKTRDLDFTEILIDTSLTVSRFLRTSEGQISPNTLSLKIEGDDSGIGKILIKNFERMYKEFPLMSWKELANSDKLEQSLVKTGDTVVIEDTFNNEKLTIFIGVVKNVSKLDTINGREITLNIEDNTIKGYENVFNEDIIYEDMYISNNLNKEKSILHILCKNYLGFKDNELDIQNIKYEDNTFIKLPIIKFEKGKKIMQEIAEIIRSIYGNIYTTNDGILKINSLFDKSYIQKLDITLGEDETYPIIEFIENKEIVPTNNNVEVNYTYSFADKLEPIFILTGQNATDDDAKIIIPKNTTNSKQWWKIDFKDIAEVNNVPIIQAYSIEPQTLEKTPINYQEYIIDNFNLSGGKLKFNNSTNKDIYIKSFKFMGKKLISFKDNSISYTERENLGIGELNTKTVNYKYVMNDRHAELLAKHTYYNECREYETLKLKTNNLPFLELEDVIKLNFRKYRGNFQIIAINQSNDYTELILKRFMEYEANNRYFISTKSNYADEEYLRNRVNVEQEKDKIKVGKYEYRLNSPKKITELSNVNLYDIVAYIQEIPLNVANAVKTICEVVKEDNGFYIKVGVVNSNNEVLATGKAIWIATKK